MPYEIALGSSLVRVTHDYWDIGKQYHNPGNYYGKLREIKTVKTGGNTLQRVSHNWDAVSNLRVRENVAGAETEDCGYDFLDRLTSASNYFVFGNTGGSPNTVSSPSKAAVDSSGNIQVADMGNYRVAKYDSSGVYVSSFGSQGSGDGQFTALGGVTIDSNGFIYTTEWLGTHRVQKFNSNGDWQATWDGSSWPSGNFYQPQDIVFNPINNWLYVADKGNNRIVYFDTNGNYQGQWNASETTEGALSGPWGVGVDSSGNIYVADTGAHRVRKFTAAGTQLAVWGGPSPGSAPGQFNYPRDVALDPSGNVWVMDTYNHRVQKLSPAATFITAFGANGTGPVQFAYPRGIALTPASVTPPRVYVVDTNNSRLQTFDPQTTAGWVYNQIGNMTLNDGKSYTYGSGWPSPRPPQPHAVWSAGGVAYQYDDNGNMTNRGAQQLTPYQVRGRLWDVENRLIKIDGVPTYVYGLPRTRYGDGNGFRVKKTEGGVTTLYINKYYEKKLSDGTVTVYYYLGDEMVAFKEGTTLRYIHQDHLTSTSVVTDTSGTTVNTIKYKAYGEARGTPPDSPAQKFTGQRLDTGPNLYYYNARYYDAALGRFISADSIVPGFSDPQNLNRYSYVLNNPARYIDPFGHSSSRPPPPPPKIIIDWPPPGAPPDRPPPPDSGDIPTPHPPASGTDRPGGGTGPMLLPAGPRTRILFDIPNDPFSVNQPVSFLPGWPLGRGEASITGSAVWDNGSLTVSVSMFLGIIDVPSVIQVNPIVTIEVGSDKYEIQVRRPDRDGTIVYPGNYRRYVDRVGTRTIAGVPPRSQATLTIHLAAADTDTNYYKVIANKVVAPWSWHIDLRTGSVSRQWLSEAK